jgi:Gas vesicle synthesis protein GvpO
MPGPPRARDDRGEERRTRGEPRADADYDEYDDDEYLEDEDSEDYDDEEYGQYEDYEEEEEPAEAEVGARAPAGGRPGAQRGGAALSAPLAARAGLQHIADLTGKQPSGVTSLERADDGWVVGVEVVEDRRIPSSTDILGLYVAQIGADGSLVAYRRIRRYQRGRGDNNEVT